MLKIKRVYEDSSEDDGVRVLVDRVWPRGVSKKSAHIDWWAKDAAPSTELRKWFGHEPERYPEFKRRYKAELKGNEALLRLETLIKEGDVTLVYGAKDEAHNQATVLKEVLSA
ncbi:hypothetical protein ENSA5_22320 [Enhygromyxa salina]|uniref:Uroporphyrin-III C-methyltransferase n=1 Tax=Enhygromyxa salina TaxID=215803 RepID=A0A2S9YBU1_9BACT|nr:DUF488 family protein [Enhygromyxa salina]PRQ02587.1 hypothetical protein ENSA5_22320 [Enhygromyxa salina]